MKRFLGLSILGITFGISAFFAVQRGWAQPSQPTRPFRTYMLTISSDKVWSIVLQTVDECEFTIQSEDPYRFQLVGLGAPYKVRVGLRKKKERQRITIKIDQKSPGIYDCSVKTEILEFWPINRKWTIKSGSVDTTETMVVIGKALSEKLRPYFKTIRQ